MYVRVLTSTHIIIGPGYDLGISFRKMYLIEESFRCTIVIDSAAHCKSVGKKQHAHQSSTIIIIVVVVVVIIVWGATKCSIARAGQNYY